MKTPILFTIRSMLIAASWFSLNTHATPLTLFESGAVADPNAVNNNFAVLEQRLRNIQLQGSPVSVDCSDDSNALMAAIQDGSNFIEVTAGPCNAVTGLADGNGDVPILGSMYIRGVGSQKPELISRPDPSVPNYLGGRSGQLILENVAVTGPILAIDSSASFLAIDSTITCLEDKTLLAVQGYDIGLYLNGATGALLNSVISECYGPAVLLDSSANLNMANGSEIRVPATSATPGRLGLILRSGSSARIVDSSVGAAGGPVGYQTAMLLENSRAHIEGAEASVEGAVLVDYSSVLSLENMVYQWLAEQANVTNYLVIANNSSLHARNTSFKQTAITTSNGFWDPSTFVDIRTSSFAGTELPLQHSNVSIKAGNISLTGSHTDESAEANTLSAQVAAGGTLKITPGAGGNDFNLVNALGYNSMLYNTNGYSETLSLCREGTPQPLYWNSLDTTLETGAICQLSSPQAPAP